MLVTISGLVGRAPQSLPQTTDGLPVIEAALGVPIGDGKDWFAAQFVGADLVEDAQVIRKGNTLVVTSDLTFEPLSDGSTVPSKPVVAVSGFQVSEFAVAHGMNSATANLAIATVEINGDKLTGTALDGNIKVLFSAGASEVNQGLFVPEANLVVVGNFRLGRDAGTVGIAIASVIAVVSLPVATPGEIASPVVGVGVASAFAEASPSETQIAPTDAPTKSKRKTSTRSKKAPKTPIAA
jgi:hypothetical protein